MNKFKAMVTGENKPVSISGTARSGLDAEIRGETIGVRCSVYVDHDGKEKVCIYLTRGQKESGILKFLGVWEEGEEKSNGL